MNKEFGIAFIIVILLSSIASTSVFATTRYSTNPDECVDGVCYVPQQDDEGNQVYAVVSPVGYHDVDMIKQAPRLDSLNGKTFALVGGEFYGTYNS